MKKIPISGIIAVIVLIAVIGVRYALQINAEKEAYVTNLRSATDTMISGVADAEDCGNLICLVWYNAIYEKEDTATDKYTQPDENFVSEHDALGNLFSDTDFISDISAIKQNQKEAQSLMRNLKDPPEGYEDAYDAISEFYDAYLGNL